MGKRRAQLSGAVRITWGPEGGWWSLLRNELKMWVRLLLSGVRNAYFGPIQTPRRPSDELPFRVGCARLSAEHFSSSSARPRKFSAMPFWLQQRWTRCPFTTTGSEKDVKSRMGCRRGGRSYWNCEGGWGPCWLGSRLWRCHCCHHTEGQNQWPGELAKLLQLPTLCQGAGGRGHWWKLLANVSVNK